MTEMAFSLVTVSDALEVLRKWIRSERQRLLWTQGELARRSGVPASTISRLELKGLGSTDDVLKLLFAMNRLDAAVDFLNERLRLAELPTSLKDPPKTKRMLRVRRRKEGA